MTDQNQGASIEAALLNIGNQMANVMFNLAQRPAEPLTGDVVATMDKLRKQWDAARRTPAATTGELPPLPEPSIRSRTLQDVPMYYTAGQMRDYACAAIEADRAQRQVAPASAQPAAQIDTPARRDEFRAWYCKTFRYRPQDMTDDYMLGTTAWKAWCEATCRVSAQPDQRDSTADSK